MEKASFIFKKRRNKLKNTLYALITFITIVLIAVAYQLQLTEFTENVNKYSNIILDAIDNNDLEKVENTLDNLQELWDKNYTILMIFQDHTTVNNASMSLQLAINSYRTNEYKQISDNLINFTSLLNELASENIPCIENIL